MQTAGENLADPATVEVRLMGRFAVLRDGREIDGSKFGGRKVRTLLRVLASRQGQFVSNDVLAEALWSDRHPADPAANLQVLVNRARRAVGRADVIRTCAGGYALAGPASCTVDAEWFLAEVDQAGRLDGPAALAVYRKALAAVAEPLSEDSYADWARAYRERIHLACQVAWERAAALAVEHGEAELGVSYARAAAGAEPLREAAAIVLIRALAAAGDRAAALAELDDYRRRLADELGLDPSLAIDTLHRQLLRPDPGAPPGGGIAGFGGLRFVGRDDVARQAVAGLSRGVVRIAGRSGTGKSRLLDAIGAMLPATRAAAHWAERDEPWSLARSLLRTILADGDPALAALPDRLRSALAHLLPELDEPSRDFDPRTRNALIIESARRLITRERTVIVDDLQWVDPTSLRLVLAVTGRPEGPGLIVAYRPDKALTDLLEHVPGVPVIALGGLPKRDLADLISDPGVVAAIAAGTDRTPMAVAEVLRTLHAEGHATPDRDGRWRTHSPAAATRARQVARIGQQRAIANRVAIHSGHTTTVLRLLALLGREVPSRTLAAAADLSPSETLVVLDELAAAGLARLGDHGGWRTDHDMVAEVIVADLTDGARADVQGRLAAVLERDDGDLAEQASHWLGAGDATRAASAYARAASHALAQFADAEAERLSNAGLALNTADGPVRVQLLEARAQARRRRGDLAAAREDLRTALRGCPGGPARAWLLAQLAALDSGADDLRRASELAELALVEAGGDGPARAATLEVASIIDMNLDQPDRSAARASEALHDLHPDRRLARSGQDPRRPGDGHLPARRHRARRQRTRPGGASVRELRRPDECGHAALDLWARTGSAGPGGRGDHPHRTRPRHVPDPRSPRGRGVRALAPLRGTVGPRTHRRGARRRPGGPGDSPTGRASRLDRHRLARDRHRPAKLRRPRQVPRRVPPVARPVGKP